MVRQARAVRTRRAILDAAAAVFDERGYEAATIGEVLSRAGVTKGALYFHFPSKQALAEGVLSEQFADMQPAEQSSRLQELVDTGLTLAHRMRHDPMVSAAARLSLDQEMDSPLARQGITGWIDTTERILRDARDQGELLPHVDPAETAWLFSAAWTGVQVYSQNLTARADLEARVSSLFEHLLPGIAVPEVLEKLRFGAERAAEVVAVAEVTATVTGGDGSEGAP